MHSTTEHKGAGGTKPGGGPPVPEPETPTPAAPAALVAAAAPTGPGLFQLRGALYGTPTASGPATPKVLLCQPTWSPPKGYGGQGY